MSNTVEERIKERIKQLEKNIAVHEINLQASLDSALFLGIDSAIEDIKEIFKCKQIIAELKSLISP